MATTWIQFGYKKTLSPYSEIKKNSKEMIYNCKIMIILIIRVVDG